MVSGWTSHLPITFIWEELSRIETECEFKNLEQFLFDHQAKNAFAFRLVEKYPKYSYTIRVLTPHITGQILSSKLEAPDNKNYTRIQKYSYPGINVNLRGQSSNQIMHELQKIKELVHIF